MPFRELSNQEIQHLLTLLREIIPLQDVKGLLHRIVRATCQVSEADSTLIIQWNGGESWEILVQYPQEEGITYDPQVVKACFAQKEICSRRQGSSSVSCLAVPLIMPKSERMEGVLYIGWSKEREIPSTAKTTLIQAFTNLAAIAIENSELFEKVIIDDLTGVASRNFFLNRLEEEFARSRRTGAPLSLLLMDVDHFKEINDLYGHPTGDAVLQQFAQVLKQQLRPYDLIGRLGGDEFGVLLPDTDLPSLYKVAERFQTILREQSWPEKLQITASVGGTTYPIIAAQSVHELYNQVDEALYQAKFSGKAQAIIQGRKTPIYGVALGKEYYEQGLEQILRKLKLLLTPPSQELKEEAVQEKVKTIMALLQSFLVSSSFR